MSTIEHDAWQSDIPTEPGYYWFYGTSYYVRQYAPNKNSKTRLVRVICSREDKSSYIHNGAFVDPHKEGYEGRWLKFDPPTPPKNLEKEVDKVGEKG